MASDEGQQRLDVALTNERPAEASLADAGSPQSQETPPSSPQSSHFNIPSFLAAQPFKVHLASFGAWLTRFALFSTRPRTVVSALAGVRSKILTSFSARPFQERLRSWGARLARFFFRTRRRRIVTALVGIPLLLCLSYWLLGFLAFAEAASLVEVKGVVQTRQEDETQWKLAYVNQLLWHDNRLRTGDGSSARLLFFDVSSVDLGENTEVSIVQVAKRRGGSAIDVILKTWVGNTAIRAVRFVDPSSTFRVDTPNASTMVRGARFTVQVAQDGATQIDLEDGSAEVKVKDSVVALMMGERITLEPSGLYRTERIFEPNAQLMLDRINAAWSTPGDAWRLELTETEVNQFLAAMSQQPDFFLRDTQVWFVDGEARAATTVVQPARFDLSAAGSAQVVEGKIKPQIKAVAAGVTLPLPGFALDPALNQVLNRLQGYLDQAYNFIEFSNIQIEEGRIIVTGRKRPGAPVTP